MKYEPSLDGLRAVAILAVLLFHAFPGTLAGGFTGVDVFFVLSGYLITSVILHDVRQGEFSLREFYLRRIQRLLPNAVVMIFFTVILASVTLLPSATVKVARHGLWSLFNLSNFFIWRNVGGYWNDSAASTPLLHTWSLAVEEQFYLTFPAIVFFLARRPRSRLLEVTICLALASFLLGVYGTGVHPLPTFYFLPTRAWEPLVGAVLAAYRVPATASQPLRTFPSVTSEFAGWVGFAMLVAGTFLISEQQGFPGVIALVPTLGTVAVLVASVDGATWTARLLATPFMVLVGKLSYSIYLWHWPLIVIGRMSADLAGRSQRVGSLVGACLSLVLAGLAYWAIERPLRSRGAGRNRRLTVIAVAFSLCVMTTLIVGSRHSIPDPLGVFDRPAFQGQIYNVIGNGSSEAMVKATKFLDLLVPPPQPRPPQPWRSGGIVHDWGRQPPRVVVLGSSHATMYGALIDDICQKLGVSVAFLAADGTPPFLHTTPRPGFPTPALAREFDVARINWIGEWQPDVVLAIDRWDSHPRADFDGQLREFVQELEPHTRRIILFSQVPVLRLGEDINLREYVTWYLRTRGSLPKISPDSGEAVRRQVNLELEALAHAQPKVQVLRVDRPFYAEDGSVKYSSGRSFLYADEDHLSQAGVEVVRDLCTRAIAESVASSR